MIFYFAFGLVILGWGLTWFLAIGDVLWSRWRKSPEQLKAARQRFKRISCFGVGLGLLVWFALCPPLWWIFHTEFGEYPWFSVRELRGSSQTGFDFKKVELSFLASPETVQRLANFKGMVRQKQSERLSEKWLFDGKNRASKEFSTEENLTLEYDPKSQKAFYSYDGLD